MALAEDKLKAKLSSLNETQEAISTVGQWILFHRRHAERIAQIWLQRMRESTPNKRLVLIYLANEITQTSKIRKKEEFLRAYEPIIAEATSIAYKSSPHDIQNKIRRVVEVWRQRQIFSVPIQQDVEKQIDEIDRSKSARKPALGGSLFSASSVPPELASVAPLAISLQKADATAKPAIAAANQDYDKLTNQNNAIPSPPIHVAGLAVLVKKLAVAEGAVVEGIKARQSLVAGLEKLLEANKTKLEQEEAQVLDLKTRKNAIESRKREIDDAILKGLSAAEQNRISAAPLPVAAASPGAQERPQVEELTPPPMESFTPVGSPQMAAISAPNPVPDMGNDVIPQPLYQSMEIHSATASEVPAFQSESAIPMGEPNRVGPEDLLRSLQHVRPVIEAGPNGQSAYPNSHKKRKMSRTTVEDDFAAFAGDGEMAGIDDNLGELI